MRDRRIATTLAVIVTISLLAPLGAGAATADQHEVDDLSILVEGDGHVTVTANETPIENATVDVSVDGNESYAGTGEHVTDENGTVALPDPDEKIDVTIIASAGDETAETSVTLEPADEPDDSAPENLSIDVDGTDGVTVTVTDGEDDGVAKATVDVTVVEENASYANEGTYETDANGTLSLEPPAETVDVSFNATAGNASAETTATLEPVDDEDADEGTFGQLVSSFVHDHQNESGPLGLLVSSFVQENNLGNGSDHAGQSDRTGPPDHAGPHGDDEDGDDEDVDANDETSAGPNGVGNGQSDANDGQGPPDHAGPP
ncbi:hypothetical protein [Natrarchaeobius chitinivorans]|uniref:Uncharacterized protein n=1 Tax=Natrarchaeobius chitinivorans TaxID=1679083 RepID=A0A3N6N846_NATCH|nr:hypothetical protein [Natrarchaeobius chitinivorans]RQG94602.1 hypothetical protein EA473_10970 [Natrarchaeobius chitinivorans]